VSMVSDGVGEQTIRHVPMDTYKVTCWCVLMRVCVCVCSCVNVGKCVLVSMVSDGIGE